MNSNSQNKHTNELAKDDHLIHEKLKKSYLSLKERICRTHDLIKQYNDQLKECDRLKSEVDSITKEHAKAAYENASALKKLIKLELQHANCKKTIEKLTSQVSEYEIHVAADKQHIQQLICKIEELEEKHSSKIMEYDLEKSGLQAKVKELDNELKNTKKSHGKIKKIEKQICPKNGKNNLNKSLEDGMKETSEVAVDTSFIEDRLALKLETAEKCVITDEFNRIQDDLYPLFCDKCKVILSPPPVEEICEIMSQSCPQLIAKISSPTKSASFILEQSTGVRNNHHEIENSVKVHEPPSLRIQNRSPCENFMSVNNLLQSTPIITNQTAYYNNIRPLPLHTSNLNSVNQNDHYSDIAAQTSSMSIITLLQNRIDKLEADLKEEVSRKRTVENNILQHEIESTCRHDTNNSLQSNLILEIYKQVIGMNNAQKMQTSDTRVKPIDKKKNKPELTKMKFKKQKGLLKSSNNWKVDSIPKSFDKMPLRKKAKKRKPNYFITLDKRNMLLCKNASKKCVSDSDIVSSDEICNDTVINVIDTSHSVENEMQPEIVPHEEIPRIPLVNTNKIEASTCLFQFRKNSQNEEATVQSSGDRCISITGESDSGILSDTVEPIKSMQGKIDMDTAPSPIEHKKLIKSELLLKNALNVNCNKVIKIEAGRTMHTSEVQGTHESHKSAENEGLSDKCSSLLEDQNLSNESNNLPEDEALLDKSNELLDNEALSNNASAVTEYKEVLSDKSDKLMEHKALSNKSAMFTQNEEVLLNESEKLIQTKKSPLNGSEKFIQNNEVVLNKSEKSIQSKESTLNKSQNLNQNEEAVLNKSQKLMQNEDTSLNKFQKLIQNEEVILNKSVKLMQIEEIPLHESEKLIQYGEPSANKSEDLKQTEQSSLSNFEDLIQNKEAHLNKPQRLVHVESSLNKFEKSVQNEETSLCTYEKVIQNEEVVLNKCQQLIQHDESWSYNSKKLVAIDNGLPHKCDKLSNEIMTNESNKLIDDEEPLSGSAELLENVALSNKPEQTRGDENASSSKSYKSIENKATPNKCNKVNNEKPIKKSDELMGSEESFNKANELLQSGTLVNKPELLEIEEVSRNEWNKLIEDQATANKSNILINNKEAWHKFDKPMHNEESLNTVEALSNKSDISAQFETLHNEPDTCVENEPMLQNKVNKPMENLTVLYEDNELIDGDDENNDVDDNDDDVESTKSWEIRINEEALNESDKLIHNGELSNEQNKLTKIAESPSKCDELIGRGACLYVTDQTDPMEETNNAQTLTADDDADAMATSEPVYAIINSNKKRRLLHSQKQQNNRKILLQKTRNLKKLNDSVKVYNNEKPFISEEKKNYSNNEDEESMDKDYIPQKKQRIAHSPKEIVIGHQKLSSNNTLIKENAVESVIKGRTHEMKRHIKDRQDGVSSSELSLTIPQIASEYMQGKSNSCKVYKLYSSETNPNNHSKVRKLELSEEKVVETNVTKSKNAEIKTANIINNKSIERNCPFGVKALFSGRQSNVPHVDEIDISDNTDADNNFSIAEPNTKQSNVEPKERIVLKLKDTSSNKNNKKLKSKSEWKFSYLFDNEESKNDVQRTNERADIEGIAPANISSVENSNTNRTAGKDSVSNLHFSHVSDNPNDEVVISDNSNDIFIDKREIVQKEESHRSICTTLKTVNRSWIKFQKSQEQQSNIQMNETSIPTSLKEGTISIDSETVCSENDSVKATDSLLTRLQQYIETNKRATKFTRLKAKKIQNVRSMTDAFVRKQLQRLMCSGWQTSLHCNVVEKLAAVCSSRIIAKCIIDFLTADQWCRNLSNAFTPPAPLMTEVQQRIVTLLIDLQDLKPTVSQYVQAGIEYKLFQLANNLEVHVVESLARIYTVLARIQKDRDKVRIFCCDALYCLGLRAIPILYVVFTCWPEVFPSYETTSEILPKCIAHLIFSVRDGAEFPKVQATKRLMSLIYKYPQGTKAKDLLQELLTTFQEKSSSGIDTAIILLAKREGTVWTYNNIVRSALLPMIINNEHPNIWRVFCLLGALLRPFPIEDGDKSVSNIVEQLCDLIASADELEEQQEGIVSALLSLSRHKFNEVTNAVMTWTGIKSLQPRTIRQFEGLIQMRDIEFWKTYLKVNGYVTAKHQKIKT